MTVDVNALVHKEPTVRPPPQGVNNMMGVFRSKPRKHDSLFPRGVNVQQLGTLTDITSVSKWGADTWLFQIGHHSRGNEEATRKDLALRRFTRPIRIRKHENLVVRHLAGSNLRIER